MSQYKELADYLDGLATGEFGTTHPKLANAAAILRRLDARRPTVNSVMYLIQQYGGKKGAQKEDNATQCLAEIQALVEALAAPVAAQPTKHYRTLRGNWTNTTTHVCNHCGFETRSEHRIVAHQCDVRKAAQPQAKPLSDAEILGIAEPFGAFEFGDAQGNKRLDFARAAITAFCLKNGIKEQG